MTDTSANPDGSTADTDVSTRINAVNTRDASAPDDSRMPPAQDAANASPADLQTNPPTVPLPLTSSTGTGFDAPDAGTTLPASASQNAPNTSVTGTSATPENVPPSQAGKIDRDALAGENAPAGSQADAKAVSSTGPV